MRPTPKDEFHSAFSRYGEELRRFVRDRVPDGEKAEDVLQDVWAGLSRTLARKAVHQPRAWLYQAARNRITDGWRREAVRPGILPLDEEENQGEAIRSIDLEIERDELRAEIEEALAALPAAQREVFVRNEMEGETLREIAESLGEPLKTIISRKGYARQRLRALLRDTYADYFRPE
jgi:RNA polymerase sigma factor (sigma-70 family)